MKVFIENEKGSLEKNLFNEETLEFRKTVTVSRPYPYPYGFILDTKSGDGDNLDCFVITEQPLKTGTIIDAEVMGMFEDIEDGEEDPKILAKMPDEPTTLEAVDQEMFKDFTEHVFDHLPGKVKDIGKFYGKEKAEELLAKSKT